MDAPTIQSRFKVLLAEKELREERKISLLKVHEETGVARSTIDRLADNTIKRPPLSEIAILCAYLDCDVGDLFRLKR